MPRDPERDRKQIGLPVRTFLFTLDQIATMLEIDINTLKATLIYWDRRSIGPKEARLIIARNIADPRGKPDWRVSEREFIRWMKFKGYKFHEQTYLRG